MEGHAEKADALEREAEEMEHRSSKLEDEIGDAREDWERKKADDRVPGAAGEPEAADSDPGPEAQYPTKESDDEGDAVQGSPDGG